MRIFGLVCLVFVLTIALSIGGCVLGWFGRAVDVVQQQVDPFELQRKYELFKDEAAQLDKKKADIAVYEKRFHAFGSKGVDCPQTLNRTAFEQCMVWEQEVSGIIASYNSLAAEYNAQMAKWNYAFTNVGQLPKGADVPLPREYKPYQYE
jgi:hypothetical protein